MRRLACLALLALAALPAAAREPLSPEAARARLAAEGRLADVRVEGDLDLTGLAPAAGRLVLLDVEVLGSLRGAPGVPLEARHSLLGGLRAPGAAFAHPVAIEWSRVEGFANLDGARFAQGFACRLCRFARPLSAQGARFEGEGADFSFAGFAAGADFSAARFRAAAFQAARFAGPEGAVFDEAEFAGPARFAGLDSAAAPAAFRGAAFLEGAEFRGCRLARAVFGTAAAAPGDPFRLAVTRFGGLADFRLCRFGAGADFAGAALSGGLTLAGARLDRGRIDLTALARLDGEIDLRGLGLGTGAGVALDEAAAGALAAGRAQFAPARWPDLPPEVLDALAARAEALGARTEARALSYAATAGRAAPPEAPLAERLAFALAWPTRNQTDLARPLALLLGLWALAALLASPRGALAESPDAPPGGLLARVVEPVHLPLPPEAAAGARRPEGAAARAAAAAGFAAALVLRLGSARWRPLPGQPLRAAAFALIWLAGLVVLALAATTALVLVPDLQLLAGVIPR